MEVVATIPLQHYALRDLHQYSPDILLVDLNEESEHQVDDLYDWLSEWNLPVLFNDSSDSEYPLHDSETEFGRKLAQKLLSLLPDQPPSPPWRH